MATAIFPGYTLAQLEAVARDGLATPEMLAEIERRKAYNEREFERIMRGIMH